MIVVMDDGGGDDWIFLKMKLCPETPLFPIVTVRPAPSFLRPIRRRPDCRSAPPFFLSHTFESRGGAREQPRRSCRTCTDSSSGRKSCRFWWTASRALEALAVRTRSRFWMSARGRKVSCREFWRGLLAKFQVLVCCSTVRSSNEKVEVEVGAAIYGCMSAFRPFRDHKYRPGGHTTYGLSGLPSQRDCSLKKGL